MTIPAQKFAFDSAYNLQQCAIVIRSAAVTATKVYCRVQWPPCKIEAKDSQRTEFLRVFPKRP